MKTRREMRKAGFRWRGIPFRWQERLESEISRRQKGKLDLQGFCSLVRSDCDRCPAGANPEINCAAVLFHRQERTDGPSERRFNTYISTMVARIREMGLT